MWIRKALPMFAVAALLLAGCDATSRYKALRFFFDGVPAPEEKEAARIRKAEAEQKPSESAAPVPRGHAPYAKKQCESCHIRPTNSLVAPVGELCFRCHQFRLDKKWVHGPLASGGCRVCHAPHSSAYPRLLVAEPETFCLYCHDGKAVAANDAHAGASRDCTACHDAHMSDERFLLK